MRISQDWHIHTFRSACGRPDNTIPAIVEVLDWAGIDSAGISDHIDEPGQQEAFLETVAANRSDLQGLRHYCRVRVGAEASMLSPDQCALDPTTAEELDFVIVAANHYHLESVENPPIPTAEAYANHHLDMLMGAAELGFATTVSHPFLHTKLGLQAALEILEAYDESRLSDALSKAAQADMALEINPRQVQYAVEWYRGLVQEGRHQGVRFTLGSDSHTLITLGYPQINGDPPPAQLFEAIGLTDRDLKPLP